MPLFFCTLITCHEEILLVNTSHWLAIHDNADNILLLHSVKTPSCIIQAIKSFLEFHGFLVIDQLL